MNVREKTRWRKGVGRVGEGIEVTAVLYEVHILSRQSLTRKERLEGKSGNCSGQFWDICRHFTSSVVLYNMPLYFLKLH
jgi:hypothetical protein